jgi:hypothetical protein
MKKKVARNVLLADSWNAQVAQKSLMAGTDQES